MPGTCHILRGLSTALAELFWTGTPELSLFFSLHIEHVHKMGHQWLTLEFVIVVSHNMLLSCSCQSSGCSHKDNSALHAIYPNIRAYITPKTSPC